MDGVGLTITSVGAVLVYAGVKGYSFLDVVRNVVTGKPITENVNRISIASEYTDHQTEGSTVAPTTLSGNKALGQQLASQYGWGVGLEWQALDKLWTKESDWNNKAINYSSGAYGIVQALPPTKLPAAGQAPPVGTSDAAAQITWGLNYISSRYRTPIFAWAHHQTYNWY